VLSTCRTNAVNDRRRSRTAVESSNPQVALAIHDTEAIPRMPRIA
jgi:hypothetical protein